jgi:hypothetical protein
MVGGGARHLRDGVEQIAFVQRLPEYWHAGRADGSGGEIVVSGDEDDRDPSAALAQLFFHFEPVHAGQADINDRAIGFAMLRQIRFSRLEQMHLVTVGAQRTAYGTTDIRVIVNDNECQLGCTHSHVTFGLRNAGYTGILSPTIGLTA